MVKFGVYVETDEAHVKIEPKGDPASLAASGGEGGTVAAPNFGRILQIAACVAACIATPAGSVTTASAAGKGGQHESPPSEGKPNPHGKPRA